MNGFDIEQYVRNRVPADRVSRLNKKDKEKWMKERFDLAHGGSKQNKKKVKKKRRK